ncbi:MAG: NUDIX hydrolase [Nanoarchaeota archaeon]|nr:NUDIX hydrolase [Nanoarchaeota archaeon]MBU1501741.1 NUDIX hydrolase [Nanoarchaeota archaeon]MBU2459269.1 NUDIX hydrolase [Nanoarchaeota archaeon]
MIYKKKPQKFNSRFEVVSCFVEHQGEILLLHRQDYKPEGNTWGVPAGKVDEGEIVLNTIMREIQEETGFALPPSKISYFDKVYVKYPGYDFVYHIFHACLDHKRKVSINPKEHKDFKWTSPKNALKMPLIQDLDTCIKLFYDNSNRKLI